MSKKYKLLINDRISLNEMTKEISGTDIQPIHSSEQPGVLKYSEADISEIQNRLGNKRELFLKDALKRNYKRFEV